MKRDGGDEMKRFLTMPAVFATLAVVVMLTPIHSADAYFDTEHPWINSKAIAELRYLWKRSPSNWESFVAAAEYFNTVTHLDSRSFRPVANYNPLDYVARIIGEDDLLAEYEDRLLDTRSGNEFLHVYHKIRREQRYLEEFSANPVAGFFGGLAGFLFDPIILILGVVFYNVGRRVYLEQKSTKAIAMANNIKKWIFAGTFLSGAIYQMVHSQIRETYNSGEIVIIIPLLLLIGWVVGRLATWPIVDPNAPAKNQIILGLFMRIIRTLNKILPNRLNGIALKWIHPVAEKGNANAQFLLGLIYRQGQSVKKSDAEAVKWFQSAAKQGDAESQFYLGVMYSHGRGVKKDFKKAMKWYQSAAEQQHAEAQVNLGVMYWNGWGVVKNKLKAYMWTYLAAEQGDKKAKQELDLFEKKLSLNEIKKGRWLAEQCRESGYKNC